MNAGNRRRWTVQDKLMLVRQTLQPGHTVSSVAREYAVNPSQLFQWKRQYQEGLLTEFASDQPVVPASELAAANRRIRELERMLGKKTLENEMLKEAVQATQAHRRSLTQVDGA